MTKIIATKFDNTKCRKCGCNIPYGAQVRWTKGEKGVTCVTCPGQVVNATTGALVENETAWESLSRRFNVVQAEANTLRTRLTENEALILSLATTGTALLTEVQQLRSALAHELQLAAARVAPGERPEITDVLAMGSDAMEDSGEYEAVAPSSALATDDSNCPL